MSSPSPEGTSTTAKEGAGSSTITTTTSSGTTTGTTTMSVIMSSSTMSSSSTSGVDWNSMIKPFVAYSVGTLSKNDVVALMKAVIDSETEMREALAPKNYSVFYDTVTVLATHVITVAGNSDLLPRQNFPSACAAIRILCESIMARLPGIVKSSHPVVNIKAITSVIQEFCIGDVILTQEEVASMLSLLKGHELPPKIQSTAPSSWDKEGSGKELNVKEIRRPRMDPAAMILEQVSLPAMSFPSNKTAKMLIVQEATKAFQCCRAGQTFVGICLSQASLKPFLPETIGNYDYNTMMRLTEKILQQKICGTDLVTLAEDFNTAYQLLKVQQFAPLSSSDAQNLCHLGLGAMNSTIAICNHFYGTGNGMLNVQPSSSSLPAPNSAAGSGNQTQSQSLPSSTPSAIVDANNDYHTGVLIVAQGLWIQQTILRILQDDFGLLQTTWLNCSCLFAKHALANIRVYLMELSRSTSSTTGTGSPNINLVQVQLNWNEIVSSVACHAVEIATNFASQAGDGSSGLDNQNRPSFQVEELNSIDDRISYFFDRFDAIEVLVQLAALSYRKAGKLKLLKIQAQRERDSASAISPADLSETAVTADDTTHEVDSVMPTNATSPRTEAEAISHEENEHIDVEIEEENHSVSDLMTTEDEDEPDDEQDDDDYDRNDEDHDDEPILGSWMESVLSPPETDTDADCKAICIQDGKGSEEEKKTADADLKTLIAEFVKEKDNPANYMETALLIISFLTRDIVGNRAEVAQRSSKEGFNRDSMAALIALILKDLDQERSATEIGGISTMFDDHLNKVYVEFSNEISKLTQNIIALRYFSDSAQNNFLGQLDIDLNTNGRWQFGLHSRSLSVLMQILLLKSDRENIVVTILKRVLDTLLEDIKADDTPPVDYADLPVEHAQSIIFMFHTLTLMQKKTILQEASRAILSVSSLQGMGRLFHHHQIMSLGRLLLLFDYFIRQLYEPGLNLITQIQYNLFNEEGPGSEPAAQQQQQQQQPPNLSPSLTKKQRGKLPETPGDAERGVGGMISASETMNEPPNSKPLPPSRLFCDCASVDKVAQRVNKDDYDESPRPKFYNLLSFEPNYQENPRLDGLAMNFLMNKTENQTVKDKDKLSYVNLIEAILKIAEFSFSLEQGIDKKNADSGREGEIYYVQYFLNRLMFGLPPPHEYLENLKDSNAIFNSEFLHSQARVLYLIVWVPRLQHRIYSSWIRDVLGKQGLVPAEAEQLVKSTTLSSKIVMKILNKTVDWIGSAASASRNMSKNPSLYFCIEAALSYGTGCISDLSEEEELLFVMIRILEESLEAVQNSFIQTALKGTHKTVNSPSDIENYTKSASHLISISSGFLMNNPVAKIVMKHADPCLKTAMEECVNEDFECFPTWAVNEFKFDILPTESYLLAVVNGHMVSSYQGSLKHILGTAVNFIGSAVCPKNSKTPKIVKEQLTALMMPLLLNKTAEFLGEVVGNAVDSNYTKADAPLNSKLVELLAVDILKAISFPQLRTALKESGNDPFIEETLQALIQILTAKDKDKQFYSETEEILLSILTSDSGKLLLALLNLLMTTKDERVLKRTCEFLSTIFFFEMGEKDVKKVIGVLIKNQKLLEQLPNRIFSPEYLQNEVILEAACKLISNLIIVVGKNQEFKPIIPVLLNKTLEVVKSSVAGKENGKILRAVSFDSVLQVIIQMASICDTEEGHVKLFQQMTDWLYDFTEDIEDEMGSAIDASIKPFSTFGKKSSSTETSGNQRKHYPLLDTITTIMEYILDFGKMLQTAASQNPSLISSGKFGQALLINRLLDREQTPGSNSPPNELEDTFDLCDSELGDDQGDEDESGGEDSDDEGLNTKLCTYTVTQKEFMSQHWYHCHTCGMVDGVGVCSICARVCHKGHDVTYAKFGSFFCDCGAKTDGSCIALVRRANNTLSELANGNSGSAQAVRGSSTVSGYNPFLPEVSLPGSQKEENRRPSSPSVVEPRTSIPSAPRETFNRKEGFVLMRSCSTYKWEEIAQAFRMFSEHLPLITLMKLKSAVVKLATVKTPIGAFLRVQNALDKLRRGLEGQLEFIPSDDLMVMNPSLGSQENAFENIKMTYNGDQGSLIRQLINAQIIRRSTIAPLTAPGARRHHLAMSQEKGKLTILQLGALLSGAEAGKKKLTLPRLANVTLPFTVLTMAANPLRDDVLCVCGLKECHVLVLGTGGSISSHMVLQPQLEGQNHIIKPLWLPGSQTSMALISADAVKIYDLGKDVISPVYYFLLPSGKVRDATFAVQEDTCYIIIIANDGRIYYEKLDENTSASNGPYYITNDLNYDDTSGFSTDQQNTGSSGGSSSNAEKKEVIGVSIHYSHALKVLFYTYPNGCSYVGVLEDLSGASPLTKAVLVYPKSSGGAGKNMNMGFAQWTEILGHPGLIFCMSKDGTPYSIMMTETKSEIQEIKVAWKCKCLDMVAMRHVGQNGRLKVSLLLLGEDGSLKVYDSSEETDFWLSSRLHPQAEVASPGKPVGRRIGANASKRGNKQAKAINGQLIFPTDFFEHCQAINDIEFGGNDLLQIYNIAQLKNRLSTNGMYVVSTKSIGFNLEAANNDASMVMTGIRVMLGSQDITRAPSFIQVFGRTVTVTMSRPRWYDIPFTREESLQTDSKLTITFGPSHDPQSITFVDSVEIYGKNKDTFGWPDDSEDGISQCVATSGNMGQNGSEKRTEDGNIEKIVSYGIELCELAVSLCPRDIEDMEGILKVATDVYLENYPPFNVPCRNLMCSVLQSKTSYYDHRDKSILNQCVRSLMEINEKPVRDIDPEFFHHIVNCIRIIAVLRPSHISQFELLDFDEHGPVVSPIRIIGTLCKVFEKLVQVKPKNIHTVPVDRPGIQRVETLSSGLAEIIYSVMASDVSLVPKLAPCIIRLLMSPDHEISVPSRTTFVKRIRPKNVRKRKVTIPGPSPPHCATPDAQDSPREAPSNVNNAQPAIQDPQQLPLVEVDEPIVMLGGQDNEGQIQLLNPLDAFMGPDGFALPHGIDLHPDAEDEAMVELAIALSLQEQVGGAALAIQGIQEGLQALEDMHQEVLHAEPVSPPEEEGDQENVGQMDVANEGGVESDATASQNSDDEGSTVATEGSTMRNSEPGGSASSGSSNADGTSQDRSALLISSSTSQSGGNTTSAYLTSSTTEAGTSRVEREEAGANLPGSTTSVSSSGLHQQLKPFRLALLKAISQHLIGTTNAISSIPLLQVILVILAELEGSSEEESTCVEAVVKRLLDMINFEAISVGEEWKRNEASETALVILRMLSILVSRWRGDMKTETSWIARITAETTERSGIVLFCKKLLSVLRPTWKAYPEETETTSSPFASGILVAAPPDSSGATLLKPYPLANPPDYTPFFLKQYVKSHSTDVLEELSLLLSEMALRLPYQVKKVLTQQTLFDTEWEELLCEMLQNRNAPFVRRQARKLLLNIAGSRENYHLLRDLHNIKFHLQEFKKSIGYDGNSESERLAKVVKMEFKYAQLVAMVEHLNSCIDIATQRPASWQTHCKNEDALQFLIHIGGTADDSLTTAILTLLKIAIDGVPFDSKQDSAMSRMSEDEKALKSLAHQVLDSVEKKPLLEFVKRYLLEHHVLSTRWQAHALMLGFHSTSDCSHQLKLVNAMWELWPFVPTAGSRAAQFVDILGYATLNNDELKARDLREQVNCCISSIEAQGDALLGHPNANIYSSLVPFVSVDGYYLESEPCEMCYNIDKPYSVQKLNAIKADAKFTANSQIVKLTSTLSIVRLSIRLTEVKKARMIKVMAIYYSPKNIPIVELKNKPNLWQMARKITLSPSQTEVKLDFSVPIVAANVMLEFLEFYENVQATAETLQCPRCSASVPAQPGVCSNCGENVYQCHKCRAINYDERDPFICHQCGHCKYAKLDISVLAKNVVAVDPIENEEDSKKAETAVSTLLEKADQTYKQQQFMKAGLESMLQSIKEKKSMAGVSMRSFPVANTSSTTPSGGSHGLNPNLANIIGPAPASLASSYANAAANALNNNVSSGSIVSVSVNNNIVTIGGNTGGHVGGSNVSSSSGSMVLKNVQSLAYCYAIDCKSSYEELNRIMRKVSAYRREMLKIDPLSFVPDTTVDIVTFRKCYGCMAASITLSLKLLQALITAGSPRDPFDLSFLSFLLRLSQSAGSTALKEQVKNALCFFVKDDSLATSQLTDMINSRVSSALNRGSWNDVSFETSEEISLLSSLLQMYDSCWEIKLRSLMKIFIQAVDRLRTPTSTDAGLLPCLKIIQNFIKATQGGVPEKLTISPIEGVHVDLEGWLNGDAGASFESWRRRLPKAQIQATPAAPATSAPAPIKPRKDAILKKEVVAKQKAKAAPANKAELRKTYLTQKYGRRWTEKFYKIDSSARINFDSKDLFWLKKLLFCPGSVQTRTFISGLLKDLCQIPERRLKIMELLTSFMEDLPLYGESCKEFMELYRDLAGSMEYAAFLNAKGALTIVCKLLDGQIEKLHRLESITLQSDLSQGVAVFELSKLLSTLAIPAVRRNKRVSLLSTVLGGYLALKRIRLHRTRPIEEAQEILLQLLEEITSGTEEETKIFMTVCVETLKKCPKEDLATPVFVFERVCSLIVHEESDVAEFFVTLDKDPQQEDFLQGRMLGNPYSSNGAGIGPLMRDIKNKICTDCELVALLEDDNGMELLVNNKIMSLDLPVKEVYKKLWLPTNGPNDAMRIIYRMRGLLGDATEEFVESFASPNEGQQDNEVTYKLAKVFVNSGGLKVVLGALENLLQQPIVMSKTKPLIAVALKLLGYCAKLTSGREALLAPSLSAVQSLLPIWKLCVEHDLTSIQGSSGVVHLTDQILEILEAVLADSCALDSKAYANFAKSRGSIEDVQNLLSLSDKLKARQATMSMHFKVLAGLTYTDKEKMNLILDSFKVCFEFLKFDEDPYPDFTNQLEHICTLVSNVETGPYAGTFKDLAIERQLIDACLEYIGIRSPTMIPPLGRPDSEEWKEMASKPALKYVLRLLAGFATGHSASQEAVGRDCVYVIHQLEQVSSDEHVGSLAENVLEALRSHDEIWKKVEAARRATREEKKKMAMAMRQRQLSTMGMKTNEKGQVTAATSSILEQMEELAEETGLICVICREGYKYHATKVLGIYTFSKRCALEEMEIKSRKTYGYSTVSHFNVVHIDCHMAAIRLARSRDEWESASLQNANTRCNGLIPLWGPHVTESAFAACLARHNAYLQEATGHRDVGFSSGVHDIKLLVQKFAEEKTFHEDTGGGGPESNMHLVPYLIHTALYVLNTTRLSNKEMNGVEKFLFAAMTSWKEDFCGVDGGYYFLMMSLMVHSPEKFVDNQVQWLRRILIMCGYRSKQVNNAKFINYRPGLIFYGLVFGLYKIVFKDVTCTGEWSSALADYIRKNDEALVKSTTALLTFYQQKLVAATEFSQIVEAVELTTKIPDPNQFIKDLWNGFPL